MVSVEKLRMILSIGETVAVEFKRCGGSIEHDVYQTVCAFLNRFGGDIYLGVDDSGIVCGVPCKSAPMLVKNFISVVSNPDVFLPTIYLSPEILKYEEKTLIRIHVPPSSEVHSYKKIIYDRVNDSDVKVTATGQIAQMYVRKQSIFTEKKIYPYVTEADLRMDLLPRIRVMAANRYNGVHPWTELSDSQLLKSAGLYGEDKVTGERGFNLAAVMLLGRDDVMLNVCPSYRTDAIVRKVNLDRYDDRLLVQTNLIESYERLMSFASKHLLDKFYLERDARISLSGAIAREMLVNTLMHREFTAAYFAKFVIEHDRMFTENANRALTGGIITPDNFEPTPKNPTIAAFFRNIGYADELGSGVRNLYKYAQCYSGRDPQLIDGDIFRIIVPIDDNYSSESAIKAQSKRNQSAIKAQSKRNQSAIKAQSKRNQSAIKAQPKPSDCALNCDLTEKRILEYFMDHPQATQVEVAKVVGSSRRTVQEIIADLKEKKLLEREGAKRNGRWLVNTDID